MLPPELIVTIEKIGQDQYLAKTIRGDNQADVCANTFTYRPDDLIDLEPQWMLERAIRSDSVEPLRKEGEPVLAPTEAEKLAGYGQRLYGFLFGDGQDLDAFLRFNDAYRRQARLTLKLHGNAAGLWRLPWEYLHDGRDFLALHGRFLLSRTPYGLAELQPEPVELPLRILVVIAAPDDQVTLDTEEEIRFIQEALDEAVRANRVLVEYLDDATLPAIGQALRRFRPHLLHYTGHGIYKEAAKDDEKGRSYLALETEAGRTKLAGIEELRPYLAETAELRLVFLSGCQTAQTSPDDAFSGVATGLLEGHVPAVLAMQFSVLDSSAIELAKAFYVGLAQGHTLAQAMQQARLALRDSDSGPGYDWGIPALYLRAQGLRLADPAALPPDQPVRPARLIDTAGLPLPPHFVGRKKELRELRHALQERTVTAAFIRGIGGIGKSSIAAKFLERPGAEIDDALVIRCHQVDPLDIPARLANFLAAQGRANHAEAAALLLDPRLEPADRARQAAALIADRRYVLVFDNFESVMDVSPSPDSARKRGLGVGVSDPTLSGLLQAQWRSLCVFTGRLRWAALADHVGRGTAIELHLPQLRPREGIMLMDNLPRLRQEPLKTKIALYNKVGGHPKSLELLNGWLAAGDVTDLLKDPALDDMLAREWEDYFLKALLAHLTPAEQEQLTRLSIFRTRLDDEEFEYAAVPPATRQKWLDLSLLQLEQTASAASSDPEPATRHTTYTIHPVVREYLLVRLSPDEQRALHRWAADLRGQPFVAMARAYAAQADQSWSEAEIEELARDRDGVVGQLVRRTDDLAQARATVARVLEWQHHLFSAGEYEPADDIVSAVHDILARWGERDRAKVLLRGSIETLEGFNKAVAQGNLATLLQQEGKLAEALAIHEELYRTFDALGAKQNMATALELQATVLQEMGNFENAIEKQEASLQLKRDIGFEQGQAISLHQLSILYMLSEDYRTALAHSQEAEELFRKLSIEAHVAATLHEQGLIYNRLARAAGGEEAATHRRTAAKRFQESLGIKRRTGDEAGAAKTLGELGKLWMATGQMQEAIAAFNEDLEIHQRLGHMDQVGIVLEFLGIVHERQGHYAAALEKYQEARRILEQYGPPPEGFGIIDRDIARVKEKMNEEGGK